MTLRIDLDALRQRVAAQQRAAAAALQAKRVALLAAWPRPKRPSLRRDGKLLRFRRGGDS